MHPRIVPDDRRAAESYVRTIGNPVLLDWMDCLMYEKADPDSPYVDDPVGQLILADELVLVAGELDRRRRLRREGRAVADPDGADYTAWRDLAREVRQRADILAACEADGIKLVKVGQKEWAGPCPLCGGEDRFRVWPGPPGRFWCRQCRAKGSVIDIYIVMTPGTGFHDALRRAGSDLGLPIPPERPIPGTAMARPTPPLRRTVRLNPPGQGGDHA